MLIPKAFSLSASRQTTVFMFLWVLMGFSETFHAERKSGHSQSWISE
jgi:hypothetical protein